MIRQKEAQYNLFWIRSKMSLEALRIFLAKEMIDKVIDISKVIDTI